MSIKKTKPIYVEKPWGGRALKRLYNRTLPEGKLIGESWELRDKSGKIPIVVKILDIKKPLSVQVHPPGKNGKSELWYVIEAGAKARVCAGLRKKLDKRGISIKMLPRLLSEYTIRPGDMIYLPGGLVHTIYPPAVLLEVSQNTLVTYRLYDWGNRKRPVHLKEGMQALRLQAKPRLQKGTIPFKSPYFNMVQIKLKKGETKNITSKAEHNVYFVLEGSVSINDTVVNKGDTVSVPDKVCITALEKSRLFKITA